MGPVVILGLRAANVSAEVSVPIALSFVILVSLVARPGVQEWRLTGRHRLTFNLSSQQKSQFTRVG
jgi:hypothetical protein